MKKIYVADKETGNLIEEVESIEEGKKLIQEYEEEDRKNGWYKKDFYDLVDDERCSFLY